ncbi:hypothetical protein FE392_06000 [Xenorhabdus sp. 12]|uniref:Uncharacterized protein n=1 Tax=Xenorhabdus santafensis TaxID=2582833 RepID=A0ABU4S7X1_9GAMM|nr:hypothetical protein [Xenorhabdus sp. 12]MDX7986884.1 hypothetical protein [Xenorhabdus sp. 12]
MLSDLIIDADASILPPPPKDILRKHVSFLRNHCDIPRGHALEMVAYFHHFSSWTEMNSRYPKAQDTLTLDMMKKIRESVQYYRDIMPPDELFKIKELQASIGTITRAVEENNLKQLDDYDIIQLHNHLYKENNDGQLVPIPLSEALYSADHCLVLLAKRVTARGYTKTVNPHLYFPWFAFRMYGYLHVDGNTLNYDCRELDSSLFPARDKYVALLTRPWFVNYVTGFIRSLLRTLNRSGYRGRLTFSRICNEGLIEQMVSFVGNKRSYKRFSLNSNSISDRTISALIDAMLEMGAEKSQKRQWIAFHYGNGEIY